jgi:hypothetical protein
MDIDTETIYELLATDNSLGLQSVIDNILRTIDHSKKEWDEFVTFLQRACMETYQKHWLKTHHLILSVFNIPELLGVDCTLFDELRSVSNLNNFDHVSDEYFDLLIDIVRAQFNNGGSTLFFDVKIISSTQSVIIASDLIQARYRETIHILNEIDEQLPSLTKEWVDVSRLWRTGNGHRMLRASNLGIFIHVKEYQEIRNLLVKELGVSSEKISEESLRLKEEGESAYLLLSSTLDDFISGLIASRGVRGEYEPHFKTWIDHEGLDDF